ncbi:MAG TPA: heme-binding domain-containing protein [Chitinophagaceae bacterium]|nr:heme-binding domain-containing protein [Chitinophagaceae bacterium]
MKTWKKILLALVVVFIVIQFFHPPKNQSTQVLPTNIAALYGAIPDDVNQILVKACNDCHSNNTKYPWYNNIQPVAWWLNNHVEEGKRHLNFSDFGSMKVARQYKRMQDCIEEIKEGDMPLNSYLWIHTDAKLTDAEKQKLYDWCNAVRDSIKTKYPADSLVLPPRPKR